MVSVLLYTKAEACCDRRGHGFESDFECFSFIETLARVRPSKQTSLVPQVGVETKRYKDLFTLGWVIDRYFTRIASEGSTLTGTLGFSTLLVRGALSLSLSMMSVRLEICLQTLLLFGRE